MSRFKIPPDHTKWPKENDYRGNVEYKSYVGKSTIKGKLHRLITQLLWRLQQGADDYDKYEAYYILGIHDAGEPSGLDWKRLNESIDMLELVCDRCDSEIQRMTFIKTNLGNIAVLHIVAKDQDMKLYPVMSQK